MRPGRTRRGRRVPVLQANERQNRHGSQQEREQATGSRHPERHPWPVRAHHQAVRLDLLEPDQQQLLFRVLRLWRSFQYD